ncbi:YHYH protein [Albirhodobacter sp. R86504]|uniref:YHYH protein n=1 Tax=Albirhodobacter sp. R86504 TaxID=3093848 RepID=UPI0036705DF8
MRCTTLALCVLAAPAFADHDATDHAQASDKLHEIAHFFEEAQVISGPSIVDCTLSGGAQTECFSITVKAEPKAYTPGPWCPTSITDGADKGGIWLQDGKVNDVDGAFVANLSAFYKDGDWQMYDAETGKIRVTDSKSACEAAARPDVDPEYQNYCVQCLPEYMEEGASVTYVIPLEPQAAEGSAPTNMTGSGVAYNGIRLDGPAPVDAILGAKTIAPFDDCGGHVNIHVGYHYHAATDCLTGLQASEEASNEPAQIGIAMDGYGIFKNLMADGTAPEGLDMCGGHEVEGLGYHYHAGEAGSNAILGCMTAQAGCVSEDPDAVCDASARPARP